MPTATILGDTYQTVVMPDGKEWLVSPFVYSGAGIDNASPTDTTELGRLYTFSEAQAVAALAGAGWRNPTREEWRSMLLACGYVTGDFLVYAGAGALKSTNSLHWDAPNTSAMNAFGFDARGGGYWWFSYAAQRVYSSYWMSEVTDSQPLTHAYQMSFLFDSADASFAGVPQDYPGQIRLVRDAAPRVFVPQQDAWTRISSLQCPRSGGLVSSGRSVPVGGAWGTI